MPLPLLLRPVSRAVVPWGAVTLTVTCGGATCTWLAPPPICGTDGNTDPGRSGTNSSGCRSPTM